MKSFEASTVRSSLLLLHLVKVGDVINNLGVVWDDCVELLERLKRVPGQTQVHIDQPQVVNCLDTVSLREDVRT